MKRPVPKHLRPGIKLSTAPCTQTNRVPGCEAPEGHYCPNQRGMKCMWMGKVES